MGETHTPHLSVKCGRSNPKNNAFFFFLKTFFFFFTLPLGNGAIVQSWKGSKKNGVGLKRKISFPKRATQHAGRCYLYHPALANTVILLYISSVVTQYI